MKETTINEQTFEAVLKNVVLPEKGQLSVLVDALAIPASAGGIRVYLQQLLRLLSGQVEVHLVCSRSNAELFRDVGEVNLIILPWGTQARPWRVLTQQVLVPLLALKIRPGLLFAPVDIAPVLAPVPIVTCVHSSHINVHLGYLKGIQAWYGGFFMRLTMWRSRRLIAISEYVKAMTVELLNADPDKIEVVYHGGGLVERALERGWSVPPDTKRTGGILFVSTLHPHKNAENLIRAYALLRAQMPLAPRLVVVGKNVGTEQQRLQSIARELSVGDHVDFMGRIPDKEVLRLLEQSRVLVYPSTSEGFGLPVLEAMQAGLPVIGSNRTSIPEVVGEAGVIIDPDDLEALAEAMQRVLTDEDLRRQLVAAGIQRGQQFNWARTADETLRVWQNVVKADTIT